MKSFFQLLILPFIACVALATSALAVANAGDAIWSGGATFGPVEMKAKYKESPENGLVDQTLEVGISGVPAGLALRISVNGTNIGSMTTNAFGVGRFRFDAIGVIPDANGRPSGPRLESGDIIRVFRGSQGISAAIQPQI